MKLAKRAKNFLLLLVLFPACAEPLWAGLLVSPSLRWWNLTFWPDKAEASPNYYAYGIGLEAGYSIRQQMDLSLQGVYLPATNDFEKGPDVSDANFWWFGGGFGFRMMESILLSIKVAKVSYQMVNRTGLTLEGQWEGTGFSLALGGVIPVGKSHFWQIGVEGLRASLERQDISSTTASIKMLDGFGVFVAYVFNGHKNYSIEGTILNDFFDTLKVF